uniref:EOG090X089S n=1 Tax=Evadne anonyx TaxID=141404 RepID=A0A9N6ZFD4_9CRUS|nr:EOG090X089S [Evadne anonyx]
MFLSSITVLKSLTQNSVLAKRVLITSTASQSQRLLSSLCAANSLLNTRTPMVTQQRYAARKGTRERKLIKKAKVDVKKEEFIPYNIKLAKMKAPDGPARELEKGKPEAIDDVYVTRHFMTKSVSLSDAIQFHKETNHESVYNKPKALISVNIELDMKLEKKNRYLDNFSRILLLPHHFELTAPRKVLAFCKTAETQEEAFAGGAEAYGGVDLIKRIQSGEVSLNDYDYFVAHTNMMAEIVPIRGLMKKRFPALRNGTMGTNMAEMIERLSKGVEFSSVKDNYDLDYGSINVPFGRLTMGTSELEDNFAAILKDVETCRARSSGAFITRCFVVAPPSRERFVVDPDSYIGKKPAPSSTQIPDDEDNDDEEQPEEDDENDRSQKRASA